MPVLLLLCSLFALAGGASAQTVRLAPILAPMAWPVGAPAPLQAAARPVASLSPSASLFALTLAALPAPAAPMAASAAPIPLTMGEWRGYFDGSLQAAHVAAVPTEPAEGARGREFAPSPLPRAAVSARPTLGLTVQPSPSPEVHPTWKKIIRPRVFWMAAALIVPGGFLILGAYWLYKAVAAYLRRRAQSRAAPVKTSA